MTQAALTYEEIADRIIEWLHAHGALPAAGAAPWDSFVRLSDLVHDTFTVPGTTVTPMMRRLLFAVGIAARPRALVAAGSYVGYALAWLLRDRADPTTGPFVDVAYAVDVDEGANRVAERNCAALGHGARLRVVTADAAVAVRSVTQPIDLLYLDVDDPEIGKAGYADVLRNARDHLAPGALVLAHDPCVARFAADFDAYHAAVAAASWLDGPWVLPVDACGLSVVVVRGEAL